MQTSRVQPCESDLNTGTGHATGRKPRRRHTTLQRCYFQRSATRRGRIRISLGRELPSLLQVPRGERSVSWRDCSSTVLVASLPGIEFLAGYEFCVWYNTSTVNVQPPLG